MYLSVLFSTLTVEKPVDKVILMPSNPYDKCTEVLLNTLLNVSGSCDLSAPAIIRPPKCQAPVHKYSKTFA